MEPLQTLLSPFLIANPTAGTPANVDVLLLDVDLLTI
jgi:hypothetical protein